MTLHGIGVSGGISIGHAHLVSQTKVDIAHYEIDDEQVAEEIGRYDAAVRATRKELEMLWGSIPDNAPTELGAFLSLHLMMLNDHTLSRDPRTLIESQKCNAEWALKLQQDQLLAQFDEIEESYLRERRADLIQVVNRIFSALVGQPTHTPLPTHKSDFILVAHDLGPADMLLFKDLRFAAFITDVGGATSHTAILARSLGIPSVLALHNACQLIHDGELMIVDGHQGVVIIDPDEKVLAEYRQRQAAWQRDLERLSSLKATRATTLDGTDVDLLSNIELPADVAQVKSNGADGIGLFRSEFLFLGRDTLPSEDEQFEAYRSVAEAMEGQTVTIRTLDLGADKNPKWATHGFSSNPALGLCGIRLCLAEPHLFRPQLRALLRASHYGKIQLLIPMISSLAELKQALMHIELAKKSLDVEGTPYDQHIAIGGMIEIPSAALTVNSMVKHLDFLSIGTNDLIQYTLAIDRTDDAVAHLYDPLHPAVLQLIQMTIKAGDKAGIPVSVCGEMGGDMRVTRLLLGLGLRKFSMHPAHLLTVKSRILQSNLDLCRDYAQRMLKTDMPEKMHELLEQLNDDARHHAAQATAQALLVNAG